MSERRLRQHATGELRVSVSLCCTRRSGFRWRVHLRGTVLPSWEAVLRNYLNVLNAPSAHAGCDRIGAQPRRKLPEQHRSPTANCGSEFRPVACGSDHSDRALTVTNAFDQLLVVVCPANPCPITAAAHHSSEVFENQTNDHCDKGCIGREHLGGEMEDALRIAECIDI